MSGRVLALAIGLLVGLGLAEAGARLLARGRAADELLGRIGGRVDDPILEYRTAPGTGENDARGYRNLQKLERASVVALGDSQTWGVNAEIDETWPAVLAQISGESVYNMGRGGYGMLQYLHQLDEALTLAPDWIVIALYFGNDLHDAYSLAYGLDAHEARRHPDPAVRSEIASVDHPDLQQMFFDRLAYQRISSLRPLQWLEENTALGRLAVRAVRRPADTRADRAWAADNPSEGFVYDGPAISTVFHTTYRLAAVDTSLPKVREGLRITAEALLEAAGRVAREPGTKLLVVLLPTKERIFVRAVAEAGTPAPASYVMGASMEMRASYDLTTRMDAHDIRYLDLLPAFEAAVARGEAIFPPNADGHFTPRGYRVIAEEIAGSLSLR